MLNLKLNLHMFSFILKLVVFIYNLFFVDSLAVAMNAGIEIQRGKF